MDDPPHRGGPERRGGGARHRGADEPTALWGRPLALRHRPRPRDRHPRGGLLRAERPGTGSRRGAPGHRRRLAVGARVVQTDREELVLHLCKINGARNGVTIDYRLADWTDWRDDG